MSGGARPQRRYPIAPVLEHLKARTPAAEWAPAELLELVALRAGYSRRQAVRWHHEGLTESSADRVATLGLGCHPCLVWPEWFAGELVAALDAEAGW